MRTVVARGVAIAILCVAGIGGVLVWASGPVVRPATVVTPPAPAKPRPSSIPASAAMAKSVSLPVPKRVESAYLDTPYVVKRVLPIEGPMRQGDWHWDDSGVPAGKGAIVITVDLAARTMSVFRDGYEIGATVVALGADEKPTPLGIFPVTQKDADHVSNIYHAPMPYMLRLTNDGVSIHGSKVGDDQVTYVTHGCIGVPVPFARKLFAAVRLGDRVIVTRGEMLGVGKPIAAARS